MGLFNTVQTHDRCPSCDNEVNLKVQFKYGDVYQHHYQLGDVIKWDSNHPRTNVGTPGHRKVVVEGIEDCPACKAEADYEVWLENDKIVALRRASGAYDFSATEEGYIIIED